MPAKKCPPAGAPDWVLTYGDMMSLLLTFFILLCALSELKKEDQYQAMVAAVQNNFGMKGGGGILQRQPFEPRVSLTRKLEDLIKRQREKNNASTMEPGPEGRDPEVTKIREGLLFAVGGRIIFEPGSAQLTEAAQITLLQVAQLVAGYTNKIDIRGHASFMDLADGGDYPDLWTLSYARAKAVADFLTNPSVAISPQRIRLTANADQEPVAQRVYDHAGQAQNRRVEVFISEATVEDVTRPEPLAP